MENELNTRLVIPCKVPGLSCCPFRAVVSGQPADNVIRAEVWCMKWRQNRMKDKVFCHCDAEFKFPGDSGE